MHKRHVKEMPAEHTGPTPVPEDREQEDDEVLQFHAPRPPALWHLLLQHAVAFPGWSHLKGPCIQSTLFVVTPLVPTESVTTADCDHRVVTFTWGQVALFPEME